MSIEGAPVVANFSLQTPLSPRAGFGLSVTNDARGLLNNSSALITFGYNIPLAKQSFIRFGISGGGAWNMLDMARLESMSDDPALVNILENNASITGNAGISLHLNTFQFGASMPAMFSPSYISTEEFNITEIKPFQSIIVTASNRFYFGNDQHVFEPYAIYRMISNLPSQYEVAGILHLNHVVWVGGSYKQDFGISALGGLKVKNALAIGVSYSVQNSGENELNSPSVELSLNFLLGKRRKDAPLYSFVNTVKEKEKKPARKSASQLIAEKRKAEEEARKKKQEELAKQKKEKEEEEAKKKADELAQKGREEEAKKRADELAQKAREEEAERVRKEREAEARAKQEEEARAREAALAKNATTVEPPKDTVRARPPVVDGRHETFKRGSHPKELLKGDYIIAGVFSSEANATRYSNGLKQLAHPADYGYLTQKQLWYVYIHKSDDINQAKAERDKYRKQRMFKDAWLLTIED